MLHLCWRVLKTKAIPVLILVMFAALAGLYVEVEKNIYSSANLPHDQIIVFTKGEAVQSIAQKLYSHNLIKSKLIFRGYLAYHKLSTQLKFGEYLFPAKANMAQIVDKMRLGKVLLHPVTIIEGLTSAQIVQELRDNMLLSGEIPDFIAEGLFLPETYLVQRGFSRAKLLDVMAKAQEQLLQQLWHNKRKDLPFSHPSQAVILASVTEKETAIDLEKPMVSAVYLNRIKLGMKLQADPTVIYGIYRSTGFLKKTLSLKDLAHNSAYNTYVNMGLPPTAICNPGKAALIAAFNPHHTDELFFVADGTGGHVFARTYAQHQKNHQQWRKIRSQKKAG